jgi:hypothetical protein
LNNYAWNFGKADEKGIYPRDGLDRKVYQLDFEASDEDFTNSLIEALD